MALKLGSLTGNIKLFEGEKSVDRLEGKPLRDPWLGIPFFLGIVVNGIGQGRQQHKGQVTADHHAYFIGAVGGFLHLLINVGPLGKGQHFQYGVYKVGPLQ